MQTRFSSALRRRDEQASAQAYLDETLFGVFSELGAEECARLLDACNALDRDTLGRMLRQAADEAKRYTNGE